MLFKGYCPFRKTLPDGSLREEICLGSPCSLWIPENHSSYPSVGMCSFKFEALMLAEIARSLKK